MKSFNKLITVTVNDGQVAGWVDIDLSTIVPADNHLVIEFVSTSCEMPSGQKPNPVIVVLDKNGSAVVQHYPVTQFQLVYSGADIHKSANATYINLSRDLKLRVDLIRDSTTGTARCFFGISGYITK
jgi:hypothetical protein